MIIIIFLVILMGSVLLGVPIAFALLLCSLAMMLELQVLDTIVLAQNMIAGADNYSLLAIPFFVLAGEVMNAGGLSQRIVELPLKLFGHRAGGLGYVAIVATVLMASLSGSAIADTAAVAALLIPMMNKAGYPLPRSAGLIASGGIIAPIIPPSIPFIVFGVAGGVSITRLFFAGIVPGLMMGAGLMLVWAWQSKRVNVELRPKATRREIVETLWGSVWALFLPVIIIGGFRLGIFTPTEAGAVAAVYAIFVSVFVYREITWRHFPEIFLAATKTVAVVMFLIAASSVTGYLMALADLPNMVIDTLSPLIETPTVLIIVIMIFVFLVGMVMDLSPNILILVPVLMPIVERAGINPVYFGVLFVVNGSIGMITPPVGNVLNVISGVAKVKFEDVVKGEFPYLLAHLVVLSLLIVFPKLVTVPLRFFIAR
ncbi:MAG: TRAP transporter large permease subunit [Planctomycetota bacterium]|nr:TRAP transporter large permease subunit [Planctomycetota bacterium]